MCPSSVCGSHFHKMCVQFQQNIPNIYRKEYWFVLEIRLIRIIRSQPSLPDNLNSVDAGVTQITSKNHKSRKVKITAAPVT